MPSLPYKSGHFFLMSNGLKREFSCFPLNAPFEQCVALICKRRHERYLFGLPVIFPLCLWRNILDKHSFAFTLKAMYVHVCASTTQISKAVQVHFGA